jgi:hypothetical protein
VAHSGTDRASYFGADRVAFNNAYDCTHHHTD